MKHGYHLIFVLFAAILATASPSVALTTDQKCVSGVEKTNANLLKCIGLSKANLAKGKSDKSEKCLTKFAAGWIKTRAKYVEAAGAGSLCDQATSDAARDRARATAILVGGDTLASYASFDSDALVGSGLAGALCGSGCIGNYTYGTAVSENCTSITGDLTIVNEIDEGSFLSGLSALTEVSGDLKIAENPLLTDLSGLSALTEVGGDLRIDDNPALTNLSGLDSVATIGERLTIRNNDSLTSLSGLSALSAVTDDLSIQFNASLMSLAELSALSDVGMNLIISHNSELCQASVDSFVTGVAVGGSALTVSNEGSCS